MCGAVDVHYLSTGGARAAAVLAADAAFAHVLAERTAVAARVPPYRPGEFYLRELPCAARGPGRSERAGPASCRRLRRPGPPAAGPAWARMPTAEFGIPVIGLAKSRFRTTIRAVPVQRGSSLRPLFVTASGMPAADAADLVRRMAGRYRLPDALRRANHVG
ncbi:MAG: hypothetical protein ACRDRJ_20710 [Streptosporangiaceae bacterium]